MIMKRLMALVALASPAALAQSPGEGNIPAPGLFDSQILCSGQLPAMPPTPTVAPEGDMSSQLDTAIGKGNVRITNQVVLDALGYVVPPLGANCGQGENEDAFTVAGQGAVAVDVAEGYSALLPHFMEVYGDPGDAADIGTAGALKNARDDLARAEADDTTAESRLASLRAAVTRAENADNAARAKFGEVSGGTIGDAAANPVYAAAIAEWMAQSAVTRAIGDYNDAVGRAATTQGVVDAMNYGEYVPLGNDALVDDVIVDVGGVPTVNLARLREYANADGANTATADADGVYDTAGSNFNAAGNLVAPNRLANGELEAVTKSTLVRVARTNLDERRAALAALKKLQTDNLNALLQPVIDEGVRRAQAEVDYYDTQLRTALADDTNRNTVTVDNPATPENEAAPFSIASRNADHIRASNARIGAEATLREAARAREEATAKVIGQFSSPQSFYRQLVSRREALKAVADREVEDAGTPTQTMTDAAEAADRALTDAQAVLTSYENLVADPDSPVAGLIDTLVETGGDDGQALVDAISQTWGRTTENMEATQALTADTDEGAEQDGPVTANRKAIDELQPDTEMNTRMVAANAGNISANAGNIAVNASNIVANSGRIGQNAGHIAANAGNIGRNAATLVEHGALIDRNAGHIALNSERIGANAAALTMHGGLIADNRHMIGELSSDLDMVRAGVAASIALSRMPSVEGGGISFGAGVYAGEMAYSVGLQVERGFGTFDIGLTSSGGEIGAGVGVGLRVWR